MTTSPPDDRVRCVQDGLIGGAECYRPVEPWEFGWGSPLTPVLCSNLRCEACAGPVRAVLGHALPEGLWRAIDFAGRLKPLPELLGLRPAPQVRTWVCACRAVSVDGAWPLALGVPGHVGAGQLRLPWRCAGHLPLGPGAMLDGDLLPSEPVAWFAHLDALVLGHAPAATRRRSVHDAAHPAFQLAHRVIHLADGRLQRALGQRVSGTWLRDPSPRARTFALDFFTLLPRFFGSEALAPALERDGATFDAAEVPGSGEPLGLRLRVACAAQVLRTSDPAMVEAMQRDLDREPPARPLTADFGEGALIRALARLEPGWLGLRGPEIAHRRRDLRPELRTQLSRAV